MSAAILAAAPALPLHTAGPYVAAAYVVFVAVILIYVAIMAVRLTRTQRELAQLRRDLDARPPVDALGGAPRPEPQPQLRAAAGTAPSTAGPERPR